MPQFRLAALLPALALASLLPVTALASDASVKQRLESRGMKYEIDVDGDFKVTYNYSKEGRTQLVFVSAGTETVAGFNVREVFSPAARVEKDGIGDRAMALLRESRKNKLGSWEIHDDVLYFVIKLPDSINAAEMEQAMDIAAQTADNMELEISGDRDDL